MMMGCVFAEPLSGFTVEERDTQVYFFAAAVPSHQARPVRIDIAECCRGSVQKCRRHANPVLLSGHLPSRDQDIWCRLASSPAVRWSTRAQLRPVRQPALLARALTAAQGQPCSPVCLQHSLSPRCKVPSLASRPAAATYLCPVWSMWNTQRSPLHISSTPCSLQHQQQQPVAMSSSCTRSACRTACPAQPALQSKHASPLQHQRLKPARLSGLALVCVWFGWPRMQGVPVLPPSCWTPSGEPIITKPMKD